MAAQYLNTVRDYLENPATLLSSENKRRDSSRLSSGKDGGTGVPPVSPSTKTRGTGFQPVDLCARSHAHPGASHTHIEDPSVIAFIKRRIAA